MYKSMNKSMYVYCKMYRRNNECKYRSSTNYRICNIMDVGKCMKIENINV